VNLSFAEMVLVLSRRRRHDLPASPQRSWPCANPAYKVVNLSTKMEEWR